MKRSDIATRIKERREELGMSVADLASRVSLSKATIHRYESGEIQNIKMPIIYSIARELKVTPGWLSGKTKIKEGLDRKAAIDRYKDVNILFDELRAFFESYDNIISHGKTIREEDRMNLSKGIEFLRSAILDRYK